MSEHNSAPVTERALQPTGVSNGKLEWVQNAFQKPVHDLVITLRYRSVSNQGKWRISLPWERGRRHSCAQLECVSPFSRFEQKLNDSHVVTGRSHQLQNTFPLISEQAIALMDHGRDSALESIPPEGGSPIEGGRDVQLTIS